MCNITMNIQKGGMNLVKIFLSSHGMMASGMENSLNILLGTDERLSVFDAYTDESSVQEKLELLYKQVKEGDQVILLSDLYGGSVNQAMSPYSERKDTILITGVNLPFMMELMLCDEITQDKIEELISDGRSALKRVVLQNENTKEEEFF